jgi:hypothetical protein
MVRPPKISVPRHLTILGQALSTGIETFEKGIRENTEPSVTHHGLHDLVDSLQTWGMIIGRIDRCSDLLMTEIVERPDISEFEIYRQIGRFEGQLLDTLIAASRPLHPPSQSPLARPFSLWNEVRWHLLSQVMTWLRQIREVLVHPETAYQTRDFSMEGEVAMFEINLTLSLPPAMAQLQEWALERAAETQNYIEGSEYLAESRSCTMSVRGSTAQNEINRSEHMGKSPSYEMSPRYPTDYIGRAILKLLSWILLVDVLGVD